MPGLRARDPGGVVLAPVLLLQVAAALTPAPARFDGATFDPLVRMGIERGAYPGAALVVGRHDAVLFAKGYGHFTWSPSSPAVDPDSTLYDLASLTKILATTSILMVLVDERRVSLDAPVHVYVPEFSGAGTTGITVRQLLTHTSGLRATLPLYDAPDSAAALRMVFAAAPIVPPGTRVIYSDLNAILLGEIVRRVAREPLDAVAAREIFVPLGLRRTVFRPGRALQARIAPTGLWHGHAIGGVVNDQNAARLGGVAGHAGLFASAGDVARFAQLMLREGILPEGRRLVRVETLREFIRRATPTRGPAGEVRALGWQGVPTGESVSSAGALFGPNSYGHTGWTGTSLWIDPDRDLFVVLLTNRAFAPRAKRSFTLLHEVRGSVADAAARASDGRCPGDPDLRW